MTIRYLVLGADCRLHRATRTQIQGVWEGNPVDPAWAGAAARELRLVSVLCDELEPRKVYLLRLPLTAGRFTAENYLTLQIFTMPDCVTPNEVLQHHGAGWPADLTRQLAVALDVPLDRMRIPLGVGGPLFVAVARGITPKQAATYLSRAA